MLNIEDIKEYVTNKSIYWTKHCLNRINQRDILILDIKKAIMNGKIIEYYYDDYPFPSCLISGKDDNKRTIHIVCGVKGKIVYMITAYYPNNKEWKEDMKTRRKK